jgi:hypothetical protein
VVVQALLLARPLVLQQLVELLPVPPQLVQLQRLVLLLLLVLHVWGRWETGEGLQSMQCSNGLVCQQVGVAGLSKELIRGGSQPAAACRTAAPQSDTIHQGECAPRHAWIPCCLLRCHGGVALTDHWDAGP